MKTVALVAAHFPPSNLASVHRARLWARYLPEFGWRPVIVTTHWDYYEEAPDWDLVSLLEPDLEIVRTRALSTRRVRVVGDLGVRGLWWHLRALCDLARSRRLDFVHITVPSHFSALLGRLVLARTGVPYGIDYIDPWVHRWPGTERILSKAWFSCKLGDWLEPWAVARARLVTGVAPLYYEDVLRRNPALAAKAVAAAMPYGACEADFDRVRELKRRPFLFDPEDGRIHLVYAGALLPKAFVVLERLLQGFLHLRASRPEIAEKIRMHFVGSGTSPGDPEGFNVRPIAERLGLQDQVDEHPHRIGYVDVLAHLIHASGILIIGSTERHYTPSKVFQALLADRPVLALLHRESTAVKMLQATGGGWVLTLDETHLPGVEEVAAALSQLATDGTRAGKANLRAAGEFSARDSARRLAAALDQAVLR